MKELARPRFSRLLSKEFRYSSVWPGIGGGQDAPLAPLSEKNRIRVLSYSPISFRWSKTRCDLLVHVVDHRGVDFHVAG